MIYSYYTFAMGNIYMPEHPTFVYYKIVIIFLCLFLITISCSYVMLHFRATLSSSSFMFHLCTLM